MVKAQGRKGRQGLRLVVAAGLTLLGGCTARSPDPRYPETYPAEFASIVNDAQTEGQLAIWSSTDRTHVTGVLAAFARKYPRIKVVYRELAARSIYEEYLAGTNAGHNAADLLWSSAMDLQIKLVNDGYTQRFVSPERKAIEPWANWKNQAWGVTAEPVVFVYNKALLSSTKTPDSHQSLRDALRANPALRGRVATYDPSTSAFGYLLAMHDDLADHQVMATAAALGSAEARMFPTAQAIIAEVASGRAVIGYNVIGPYAADYARHDPNVGIITPRDYTLYVSRIAVIPKDAPHPNAARIFLTFLLSREGQMLLAAQSMPSIRSDLIGPTQSIADATNRREIKVGPALLVAQDQLTKQEFLERWQNSMSARRPSPTDSSSEQ